MSPPDPGAILSMWAAGVAAGVAIIAYWKVARPGFVLLGVGVAALLGFGGALAGAGWWGAVAGIMALLAIYVRTNRWATLPLAAAGLLWLDLTHSVWSWLVAMVGAVALGAVTSEMLLGHWYLVDPKLPRRPLRVLALAGILGVALDTVVVQVLAVESPPILAAVLIGLGVTSVILMIGVWFALRVRAYTGVMAATGLSYLAMLTSLGAVVLGRSVI
ncbi:MAG: hypothetical protein ACRDWH_09740 [Acidimicrobiia bacterium]